MIELLHLHPSLPPSPPLSFYIIPLSSSSPYLPIFPFSSTLSLSSHFLSLYNLQLSGFIIIIIPFSSYNNTNMMVAGKEDLGLSLCLGSSNPNNNTTTSTSGNTHNHTNNIGFFMNNNSNNNNNRNIHHHQPQPQPQTTSSNASPLQLNLMMMPSLASSTASPSPLLQKLPWNRSTDSFPPSSDRNSDSSRLFLRGIDVNRPAGGDEEDAGVSSPNSTVSTVSGKRSSGERDSMTTAGAGDDIEVERASSRGLSDDEDGGENSRKKLRLTKDQSAILEESFKEHNTLNPKQKLALAKRLGLRPRQVEVWFQNRRARTKLKQTEVDCEFLKRCCEQLTEENRRLQKEVQELRALKLSPQFYMQMTPPTTLTMCPSCERVAVPPSATSASPATQPQQQPSTATIPDSRPNHTAHHRPMPVNPWAVAAPVPIRSFEALRTRS